MLWLAEYFNVIIAYFTLINLPISLLVMRIYIIVIVYRTTTEKLFPLIKNRYKGLGLVYCILSALLS